MAAPPRLPVLSGLLLALSLPPFPFGLLSFVALVPFAVWLCDREPGPAGAAASLRGGLWLGIVLFAVVLHWIPFSLPDRPWLGPPAFLAVVAALSVYPAAVGWVVHRGIHRTPVPIWLVLPAAWTAGEWLRGVMPGGFAFPWAGLALGLTPFPRALGLASFAGEHGVTLWISLVNGLVAAAVVRVRAQKDEAKAIDADVAQQHPLRSHPIVPLVAGAIAVAAIPFTLPIAGAGTTAPEAQSTRAIRVALVQTAVSQEVREDPEAGARAMAAALNRLLPEVAPGSADLVVLPETAFLVALESPDGRPYLLMLQEHSRRLGAPLLVGAFGLGEGADSDADAPVEVYNSVFLIDADGVLGRYDKHHLVPGVERTPLLPARLAAALGDTASYVIGLTRALTATTAAGAVTLGPLVCYESAFGALAREHVRAGAQLLVNVTNDAWFGEGALGAGARAQHEAHLVLRAVESRIPVVRSANGGVSMMVEPRGRVARVGTAGEEGVDLVTVELQGVPGPIRWLEGS